jgi:hypothetical protein
MKNKFDNDYINYMLESGEFMTTAEVADFIKVSQRTLQDWRRRKTGPKYFKPSERCVRYRMEDILDYFKVT